MTEPASAAALPDREIVDALGRAGLLADARTARFERLTGGVSSDIWKVESGGRVFCVKRALPRLNVTADWRVPVERNRFEVAWCEIANRIVPGAAPHILAHDAAAMLCAMTYLDPARHRLWKDELRVGRAVPVEAAEIGRRLARIHAATAGDADVARRFPRADIFHAIRLEPYFEATARRHADLAPALSALSRRTAETRLALVHGDVSPKNILLGPDGPVFLDAECACIGDPAFDVAFCVNHLLLKCLWRPASRAAFFDCYEALAGAYIAGVVWESPTAVEARAASLLPGLLLARIDGKSPVEYVEDAADKERVRRCARRLLSAPPSRLRDVLAVWREELDA